MFQASAQQIQPRAQSALRSSPIYALRDLRVEELGGSLQISGLVASYYHKQLAQEAVRAVAEGVELVNSIDVREGQPVSR